VHLIKMALSKNMTLVRSETDLFSEPGWDVSLDASQVVEHHPQTSVSDRGAPLQFFIQGNDLHYVDLSQTLLYLRCTVKRKSNGDPVPTHATSHAAPVNNLLHSLFSSCNVKLNEVQTTVNSDLYPYRSYIETTLAFGGDYKDNLGRAQMYYRDSNPEDRTATDYVERQGVISEGKEFDLIGRPNIDLCNQSRYIIPGIDIRIEFRRSKDDFYMHTADAPAAPAAFPKYAVNILEAKLLVMKHILLPSIQSYHHRLWESGRPASYPMRHVDMKSYGLAIGTTQNINENLINGHLPDRIIVSLVATDNFHGRASSTPFSFKDFGLESITVTASGTHQYVQKYEVDVPNHRIGQAYYGMFSALALNEAEDGPNITYEEFKKGKLFFCFNIRQIRESFTLPRHGNVKIDLQFRKATTEAVTVIVHCDYQALLQIDRHKNIITKDYSLQP
jgi:hypothetical protein